jgi:hypothetical protein
VSIKRRIRFIGRVAAVLGLWTLLSAATVRCSGSTFGDDDEDEPDRNRAPVASTSFLETRLGQAVSDRMQASDPDGDPLTFRVTAGPDRGSLTGLDDRGDFTYVPSAPGSDQFSFRANDGELDSNTAQVVIRVTLTGSASAGPAKAAWTRGLATALGDSAGSDALLVLWSGPEQALERVPVAGAPETLVTGVRAVAADPWQPGRLVVLKADGALEETRDAGRAWRTVARLAPVPAAAALALAGDRLIVASADRPCGAASVRVLPMSGAGLRVEPVCGRAPSIGPDGNGYVLQGAAASTRLVAMGQRETVVATGVLKAGADPARPSGLWRFVLQAGRPRLQVSADAGATWAPGPAPPDGRFVDALALSQGRAGLWLAMADGGGGLVVMRLNDGEWSLCASLPVPGGRLLPCGTGVCLLDTEGRRLWRVPAVTASAR